MLLKLLLAVKIHSIKILLIAVLFLSVSFVGDASFTDEKFSFKEEILSQINRIRTRGCNCGGRFMPPVTPVIWNDKLAGAAAAHAQDMANQHYFSHESRNGDHIQDRFQKAGYGTAGFQRYVIGENIAQGQQSIEQVNRDLFRSEAHCKNLMNPDFKEIGVFVYNYYWVEDFGGRYPFNSLASSKKN
ncbi:MAG: CAP domain-containing protein [Sphingobacteriaceae bacterium]|nr:MAG: CAP domain-containing protein [Sphingobacteriaceae bacterium]